MDTWICREPSPFISTTFLKDSTARREMRMTRNWKWTTVPKYQVLRLGLERNTWLGGSCLLSTADARCWYYISHNGETMRYSENHCARGLLRPTVTNIKPRICPFPTFFAALAHLCRLGMQPHCRGCSASFPRCTGELAHELAHNLPSHRAVLTFLFLIILSYFQWRID